MLCSLRILSQFFHPTQSRAAHVSAFSLYPLGAGTHLIALLRGAQASSYQKGFSLCLECLPVVLKLCWALKSPKGILGHTPDNYSRFARNGT